jgi:hypothetical protein
MNLRPGEKETEYHLWEGKPDPSSKGDGLTLVFILLDVAKQDKIWSGAC